MTDPKKLEDALRAAVATSGCGARECELCIVVDDGADRGLRCECLRDLDTWERVPVLRMRAVAIEAINAAALIRLVRTLATLGQEDGDYCSAIEAILRAVNGEGER